jgi:cobalt-zinc-cadmium efflux system outer membrane protein
MTIRTTTALLLVSGTLVPPAVAQNFAPAGSTQAFIDARTGLSLDQAIARALEREPALRAERTAIDAARAMREQAGLRRNPSVSMEWRAEPAGTDEQTMVNVEWPLDLFRRGARTAVADREIAATELSVADRERLLTAEVRTRYGEVLAGVRELEVLEELLATLGRQHELIRVRVDEGASPPLERDLLDVELRRIEAERLLQMGRIEAASVELKRLLGMPPTESLRLRDTLEAIVIRQMAASSDRAGADPTDQRADVREAQARIGVAEAKIDRTEREGRFDVKVVGGYTRMDAGFPQFGFSATGQPERVRGLFHYLSVGAMVSVPLFNRNQGETAAAHAERSVAVANLEAARLSAQAEVAAARSRDERAHQAVKLYGSGARTLARQNLSVVEQSYELGRSTVFDVVNEQKRLLEIERAYTDTLRTAYEARTSLDRALGAVK